LNILLFHLIFADGREQLSDIRGNDKWERQFEELPKNFDNNIETKR